MSEINRVMALLDDCDGDRAGLEHALGVGFEPIKSWGHDEGFGHHGYNTLYRAGDGRLVHAECGGCSCGGYGSWSYIESIEEGERLVPEWMRETNT